MEQDLLKIKKLLINYINLINKEYKYSKINLESNKLVLFNESNTITFLVCDGKLLLPSAAYNFFELAHNFNNYGINKNNYRFFNEYLDTNTTYMEYIDHVIECAFNAYDYFEENLLHEAMHLCGSGGGSPLEEGINELKTRELAMKYKIKIAAYGYSKEVEVAKKLQNILGKELMDDLTFIANEKRYEFLLNKATNKEAILYQELSNDMINLSKDYFEKVSKLSNPYDKAKLYETIDYSILYKHLDNNKIIH